MDHISYAAICLILFGLLFFSQSSHGYTIHRMKREPSEAQPSNSASRAIIKGPLSETIVGIVGETERLPCEVDSGDRALVQWFKGENRINSKDNMYQVLDDALKIKNVRKISQGTYTCRVEAQNGATTQKVIHFLVEDEPEYATDSNEGVLRWARADVQQITNIFPVAGKSETLDCMVKGEPNISVTWYLNGTPLLENDSRIARDKGQEIKFKSGTHENTRLMIKPVLQSNDQNNFTCKATQTKNDGSSQQLERSFVLILTGSDFPLTIVNDNKLPLEAQVGQNFSYECRILKPEMQKKLIYFFWVKIVDYNSTTKEYSYDKNWHNGTVYTKQTLELINVTPADEGQYACVVSDKVNQAYIVFNVTVRDPQKAQVSRSTTPTDNSTNMVVVIAGIVGGVLLVTVIIIIAVLCVKYCRKPDKQPKKHIILLNPNENYLADFMKDSNSDLDLPLMPPTVHIEGRHRLSSEITSYSDYEFPLDEAWEILPRNRIRLMHMLGEGAFGCVFYAELQPASNDDNKQVQAVAVKMLKSDATNKELLDLAQELEVLKRFNEHENIIELIGCMTRDGPLQVVVEFARHGNLRDFLKNHRPMNSFGSRILCPNDDIQLTHKDLVSFAYQVAKGMEYLASKQCLHRDLAARNVLVTEDLTMKIADFGLSRNIAQSDYYKKVTEGKLPIKWMAPETLIDRKYTSKSDVWSYGVLLWEIFTLGGNPYPTVPHERLFEVLKEGHRMDKPPYSSLEMYTIMRQCWQHHAAQRPTFTELVDDLDRMLTFTASDEYLNIDCSPLTSPCTSTTSCEGEEPHLPPPPTMV